MSELIVHDFQWWPNLWCMNLKTIYVWLDVAPCLLICMRWPSLSGLLVNMYLSVFAFVFAFEFVFVFVFVFVAPCPFMCMWWPSLSQYVFVCICICIFVCICVFICICCTLPFDVYVMAFTQWIISQYGPASKPTLILICETNDICQLSEKGSKRNTE